GPALTGVVAGEVQMTFDPLATSLPLIKDGKLRALAITGPARVPALPDVPTMDESGYQSFTVGTWTALLAPKGHAAGDRGQAQRCRQRRPEIRADAKHARQIGRRAARRHAAGARRLHGERTEKVEADRRGAEFESGLSAITP